jgi:hypothetical protein
MFDAGMMAKIAVHLGISDGNVVEQNEIWCYISRMTTPKATSLSSMEETIREAEEFGASVEEARKIHDVVNANTTPSVVKTFQVKFGPDSTDNRAVWIRLIVENDLRPSSERIAELNREANKVRTALLRENLSFWPYVEVRGLIDSAS